MSEQAQVGDTVRLTIIIEDVVEKWRGGGLNVGGYDLDRPGRTVEILSRATPPLPSEPGTWWLDKDDDVWGVDIAGDLYPLAGSRLWVVVDCAPFRQLVLK